MNTPISWIRDYIDGLDCTDKEYMDKMTLFGTKVENFTRLDADLDKIVIGQIKEIEKHPDADKLVICQVDIGESVIQIVTGANNIKVNDKVPVVLDGGKVATGHDGNRVIGGTNIKKGKLRGIESNGMLCSIDELGSSRFFYPEAPENGIYIFGDDAKVGSDAIEALGFHDTVFEYEITSNRIDCFSMIGIAREAAAAFKKTFRNPVIKATGDDSSIDKYIDIKIEDGKLCKRMACRVIEDLKIEPSPIWLQRRLSACGIRPINNIVDITNYVMKEYGQPMHAYDINTLEGNKLIAKLAKAGDEFTTLDGVTRKLDPSILMIADDKKYVGIAGIMGGQNSMITDDAKTMLLECACFDGTSIRLSSKKLGLRTEASSLFEKGLSPVTVELAINRACELIEMIGAGRVVGKIKEVDLSHVEEKRLDFDVAGINKLLGTNIDRAHMESCFSYLGFNIYGDEIVVPYFREDINLLCDLAEEVARYYGYDNIPTTIPKCEAMVGGYSRKEEIKRNVEEVALSYGYSEAMSYSFESAKTFDKLYLSKDSYLRKAIEIINPLGEDYKIMRTQSLNGLLNSLSLNYNRRNKSVSLYEMATIYRAKELPLVELPHEHLIFTAGFYNNGDFYDIKGLVEECLCKLKVKGELRCETNEVHSFLHETRQATMYVGDTRIGIIGQVHPKVCKAYDLCEDTYITTIDLKVVEELEFSDIIFEPIPKYPISIRDLSLICNKSITCQSIKEIIAKNAGKNLENVELYDVYEDDRLPENHRSLTFSLVFRAKDKTLSEEEIQGAVDNVVSALESANIKLREY